MKNVQEILQSIVWKDDSQQSGNSLGALNEAFPDAEILIVKHSKSGARRATIMVKKDKKVTNLICSERLTDLLRSDKLTKENLVGFPVIYNDKQNSLYLGLPSDGWVEVKAIKLETWKPAAMTFEEKLNAAI